MRSSDILFWLVERTFHQDLLSGVLWMSHDICSLKRHSPLIEIQQKCQISRCCLKQPRPKFLCRVFSWPASCCNIWWHLMCFAWLMFQGSAISQGISMNIVTPFWSTVTGDLSEEPIDPPSLALPKLRHFWRRLYPFRSSHQRRAPRLGASGPGGPGAVRGLHGTACTAAKRPPGSAGGAFGEQRCCCSEQGELLGNLKPLKFSAQWGKMMKHA